MGKKQITNIFEDDYNIKLGDGTFEVYKDSNLTDGRKMQADGSERGLGTAVLYDDIIGNLFGQRLNSTSGKVDYDWAENALKFQTGGSLGTLADRVQLNMQLPHKAVIGANAYFRLHFHWFQTDIIQRTLSLEYRIQNNGAAKNEAWNPLSSTTNNGNDLFTYTSGTLNQITTFDEIDVTTANISSTLQFRIARTDTNTGDLLVYFLDSHYAIDSDGSMSEWSKEG